MIARLYVKNGINEEWGTPLPVYNSVSVDERLDEQFDSGLVQTITESETPFEDFCMVKLTIGSSSYINGMEINLGQKTFYFYGFDTVEKRGEKYYVHSLELIEPTRLLMGVFIDGMAVTQPIEGNKKTLKEVLVDLIYKQALTEYGETPFFSTIYADTTGGNDYEMEEDDEILPEEGDEPDDVPDVGGDTDVLPSVSIEDLLSSTESPEFHWSAGTSLWECLCDIGNVINCIPRLLFYGNIAETKKKCISFDAINNVTGVYEL